ncbi:hypothetical protein HDU81_007450 [Chytriomyces hyalinus]|nr:hypothetical protein HDU81_007450 [Chytriomyces hyalinus]
MDITHAIREQCVHDAVLNEINLYRTLLRMPPLASVAAFSPPSQPVTPDIPKPVSPHFESMPTEILDRIASFVDGDSILNLCHSIPYFKYISKAMMDIADTFPSYDRLNFWPHYKLPTARWTIEYPLSGNIDYKNRHLYALSVYSRIVSRHSGSATVACSKGFDNVVGALPDNLKVIIGDVKTGRGLSEFLRHVVESKKKLIQLEFEFDRYFDTGGAFNFKKITRMLTSLSPSTLKLYGAAVPQELLNTLPHIKGLSLLHISRLDQEKAQILSHCADLEEVEIRMLQFSKDLQLVLPRLLAYMRESRVRKVSYMIHHMDNHNDLEADASWIDSVFVVHGWCEVREREDYRTFQRGVNV